MTREVVVCIVVAFASVQVSVAAIHTVPGSFATIQQAVSQAPSGSVIEVAPGTYVEFIKALDLNKHLYFRATGGPGTTMISGANSTDLLYVANGVNGDSQKNLVFDGFTFAHGNDTSLATSPITIADAKTVFLNCIIRNNQAALKGGALLVYGAQAHPLFMQCTFNNNFSGQTGGAALINGGQAQATFKDCLFEQNSNRWADNSADDNGGGAVYFGEAGGSFYGCEFRGNSCSYAGGAITSITPFDRPEDTIRIEGCTFDGNFAEPLPGRTAPGNTEAGAVFSEANVRVEFYRCLFTNNWAQGGGAIQSYRAHFDISDSVFVNNRAEGGLGTGGAISMNLDDAGDVDRREADLTISNVLIRDCTGHAGGGIYHAGDQSHGHQGHISLTHVVIEGCGSTSTTPYNGHGGGMYLQNSQLVANDVSWLNNYAAGGGGAITLVLNTSITGTGCRLIGNEANGNHAVYDPGGKNPVWIDTYQGYNPPAYGGAALRWFSAILGHTLNDTAYLAYGVSPADGSTRVQPGAVALPGGSPQAGSLARSGVMEDTLYTLDTASTDVQASVFATCGSPETTFLSSAPTFPGWVEAENYDRGAEGVSRHDTTTGNAGTTYRTGENVEIGATSAASGGHLVGWIAPGEWLEYTVRVLTAGRYILTAKTAAPVAGGKLYLQVNGETVGGVRDVPATGGWTTWGGHGDARSGVACRLSSGTACGRCRWV